MPGYNTLSEGHIETLTGFKEVIQSDHAYIHQGLAFTYNEVKELGIGATYNLIVEAPAGSTNKYVHWRPALVASSASGVAFHMTEDPTYTTGTDVTDKVWNRNRGMASIVTPEAVIKHTPGTITDTGTLLESVFIGAGGSKRESSGGASSANEEILLAADTPYLLQFINEGGVVTELSINIFWYEEAGWDGRG